MLKNEWRTELEIKETIGRGRTTRDTEGKNRSLKRSDSLFLSISSFCRCFLAFSWSRLLSTASLPIELYPSAVKQTPSERCKGTKLLQRVSLRNDSRAREILRESPVHRAVSFYSSQLPRHHRTFQRFVNDEFTVQKRYVLGPL